MNTATSVRHAYALVIGIGDYQCENIRDLEYTRADAKAFRDLLVDPDYVGLPAENVMMLLDDEATLRGIKKAISGWLFTRAGEDSTVLIFFAGHGGNEADKTGTEADGTAKYLLPWDAESDDLFSTALANTLFKSLLRTIRARRMVVFLDACFAAGVTQTDARDVNTVVDPYRDLLQGEGRIVIASAKPNQQSYEAETLQHGVFSYHLLEALRGKADVNDDGLVSVMDVFTYLQKAVPDTARRLNNAVQEPVWLGDNSGRIVLAANRKRLTQRQRERDEQARQRDQLLREKKRSLYALNEEGELPTRALTEALSLLEKSTGEMSVVEKRLLKFLELLLAGNVDVDFYLASCAAENRLASDAVRKKKEIGAKTSEKIPSRASSASGSQPKKSQPSVFCTQCGAALGSGDCYCTQCGCPVADS